MDTNLKKLSQNLEVGKASQVKCLSFNAKFVYIINYIIKELIGEGNHLIDFNLVLVTAMLLVFLINISFGSASLSDCFPCCFCTSMKKYWIIFLTDSRVQRTLPARNAYRRVTLHSSAQENANMFTENPAQRKWLNGWRWMRRKSKLSYCKFFTYFSINIHIM